MIEFASRADDILIFHGETRRIDEFVVTGATHQTAVRCLSSYSRMVVALRVSSSMPPAPGCCMEGTDEVDQGEMSARGATLLPQVCDLRSRD